MTPFTSPIPRSALAWLLALVLCALALGPAAAQDTDGADPPGRVGRLAAVEGQVWVHDAEANEWVEAPRNRPVTTGDRLATDSNGRAEVRVGSTTVRLDRSTELEVTALDDDRLELDLRQGDLSLRLRAREAVAGVRVVTPEGAFVPERVGTYRLQRTDDGTEAMVDTGQLQLRAADAGVTVKAGQRYRFWQQGGTQFELAERRRDDFDAWVAAQDDREARSVSARYVSPEMTGVEDLDRHGRWEQDTELGAVWYPTHVVSGWAPYRQGHWVWISPWGWTWVDDAPWGFAPFHYGRWVSRGGAWGWAPGAYTARPVYAPALVGWVGGPGASVSITVGRRPPPTVGWFPLGPHEVYVPWHRHSPHYMRHINAHQVPRHFDWNPYVRDPRHAHAHGRYRYRDQPVLVPGHVMERRYPVGPAIVGRNGQPLPGWGPDRPRPGTPRPPMMGGRPDGPSTGLPSAPGGGSSERYGAPRFGRDDRGMPGRRDGMAPPHTVGVPAPAAPVMRPAVPRDERWSTGRDARDERWSTGRDVREERWSTGRDARDERWSPGGARPPGGMAPSPQHQPAPQWQAPRPSPSLPPPMARPPQMSSPSLPPSQHPQPGFGGGGRGAGPGPQGGGHDGPRHRRMD